MYFIAIFECTNMAMSLIANKQLSLFLGYFRDTIGTYDYIFYINGIVGILTGLIWVLEPYFRQCSTDEKSNKLEAPVQV